MDITSRVAVEGLVISQMLGENVTGPQFVCCLCNTTIDSPEDSQFTWDLGGTKALIVHKLCNIHDGDRADCVSDVGTMLMYLLWNTGLTDSRTVKKWADIAQALLRD